MKILWASFEVNNFGGITTYMCAYAKAFKDLGHDVSCANLTYRKCPTQQKYQKKIDSLADGTYFCGLSPRSQNHGYFFDTTTQLWCDCNSGFIVPPSHHIDCFEEGAVAKWNKVKELYDVVFYNNIPSMQKEWKGLWFEPFFQHLGTPQILINHDIMFHKRSQHFIKIADQFKMAVGVGVPALEHLKYFDIPRKAMLNGREMGEFREYPKHTDFASAHVYKGWKHVEWFLECLPFMRDVSVELCGGSIEHFYMALEKDNPKHKSKYINEDGRSILNYAKEVQDVTDHNILPPHKVLDVLRRSKFFVDMSYQKSLDVRAFTNNGSFIEAVQAGCYPILIDGGEGKNSDMYDVIRAIYIPLGLSPRERAKYFDDALNMPTPKYVDDRWNNFNVLKELLDVRRYASEIIDVIRNRKWDEYPSGQSTPEMIIEAEKNVAYFDE